ncbi:hypothetical protein ACUUL3_13405 [Thiovibrio sp. JS02]
MKGFCDLLPERRVLLPLLFFAFLLLAPLFCASAGRAAEEKSPPPDIMASFEAFSKSWMSRLDQVSRRNSLIAKPEAVASGRLRGRYLCYGPDCEREVRGTGSKATPYVGIIRYVQREMEKEGKTLQEMREHPGVATGETKVTEIFRYTGGRWVY